jgi:hypothetical protein
MSTINKYIEKYKIKKKCVSQSLLKKKNVLKQANMYIRKCYLRQLPRKRKNKKSVSVIIFTAQ